MSIGDFFNYLVSAELQSRLSWLRIVFLILAVYFIFGIIYFGRRGKYFHDRGRRWRFWGDYKEEFSAGRKHQQKWAELEKLLKGDLAADHKRAVVEAGRLFEEVLGSAGAGQGSFEDRVGRVIVSPDFDVDDLFRTHRLWREIIDDPARPLSREQAKEALEAYRLGLVALKYF